MPITVRANQCGAKVLAVVGGLHMQHPYLCTCFSPSDKLIGVHCTHGLNRTGYLICRCARSQFGPSTIECGLYLTAVCLTRRYLIDVDGMEPKEAVKREFRGRVIS